MKPVSRVRSVCDCTVIILHIEGDPQGVNRD